MECSCHVPLRPGLCHQRSDLRNQEQLTISTCPSPSTSSGRSLKLSTYPFEYGRLRNSCFFQFGASYQFSPDTISSLPSPFTSASAQVSLAPISISCLRKAMSPGRLIAQSPEASKRRMPKNRNVLDMDSEMTCTQPLRFAFHLPRRAHGQRHNCQRRILLREGHKATAIDNVKILHIMRLAEGVQH